MKITDIKTYILSGKLEEATAYGDGIIEARSSVVVKMETDEGIIGWGESMCHGNMPPEPTKAMIDHWLKGLVIGENPFNVEVIWEKMYNHTLQVGQSGIAINAMSGIDIAIWDILGKALNQPVYNLLGGAYRTKLTPYATGFYKTEHYTAEDAIEEAQGYIDKGFKAIKLAIGFGVEEDIDYIHEVREGLGYDIKIMADASCAYSISTARRILHECESDRLEFFEELLMPDDLEGFKELKLHTATSLATGENLFTKRNYKRWIAERAADIFQPEIASCGGITELKRIGSIAHAYDTRIIPHNWGSGISQAATIQFIANLPPVPMSLVPTCEPMMEFDQSEHPFSKDLIYGAIKLDKDGFVQVPDKPGLGIEVNEEILDRFSKK